MVASIRSVGSHRRATTRRLKAGPEPSSSDISSVTEWVLDDSQHHAPADTQLAFFTPEQKQACMLSTQFCFNVLCIDIMVSNIMLDRQKGDHGRILERT